MIDLVDASLFDLARRRLKKAMIQRPGPYGIAEQLAEKVVREREPCPQRLKPNSKQCTYCSGEPLLHPKSSTTPTFSASCEAMP